MALSCIFSEIKRDIGRKLQFFHTLALTPTFGGSRWNIVIMFGTENLEWCGYPTVKKFDDMSNRVDKIPACDGQTYGQADGQTSCDSIVHAMHSKKVMIKCKSCNRKKVATERCVTSGKKMTENINLTA